MVYILLIPFDVFAATRHLDKIFDLTVPIAGHLKIKMYDLYFICYILMIFLCFLGLPFSYFYAQSVQEEEESNVASQEQQYMTETYSKFQMGNGLDSSESSEDEDTETGQQDESKPMEGVRNRKRKEMAEKQLS